MKVLIDNKEHEIDSAGFLLGNDINGRRCRVAYHGNAMTSAYIYRENFKVITSGHVYVFSYNEATYKPKKPLTYKQYKKMKA